MIMNLKNKIFNYVKKKGWKAGLGLFMFFLIKGILWLILGWLGIESIKSIF